MPLVRKLLRKTLPLLSLVLACFLLVAAGADETAPNAAESGAPKIVDEKLVKQRVARETELIEAAFEARIRTTLTPFVHESEFYTRVKVELNEAALASGAYEPSSYSLEYFRSRELSELRLRTKSVRATVWIAKRFPAKSREDLLELLTTQLALMPDAIEFKTFDVATADGKSDQQIQKLEADLRQSKSDAQRLERERNDIKMELALAKAKKDAQAAGEVRPEEGGNMSTLIKSAPWLVLALACLVVLLVASRMFASSIRSIGGGVSSLAGALQSIGGGMNLKTEGTASAADAAATESLPLPDGPPAAARGEDSASHERVLRLHEELAGGFNPKMESITLKRLTDLLGEPDTVAKGVALLELLGKARANELFLRLAPACQESVLRFLSDGHFGRPKSELMLEAGEELKTRLLGEHFGNLRGELTLKLGELMLQLDEQDVVDLTSAIPDQLRARWFLYLEPDLLARTISTISARSPANIAQIMDAVPRIAAFERSVELDEQIVPLVEAALANKRADGSSKYLQYYMDLLESLDDKLAETAVERFAAADPRLRAQLSSFVVTLATLFKVPASVRKDLVEPLGNRAIASLLFGLEAPLRKELLDCLSPRRHDQINEELEVMSGMPAREASALFDQAKGAVITGLKKLRASGELAELLAANDAPAAPRAA